MIKLLLIGGLIGIVLGAVITLVIVVAVAMRSLEKEEMDEALTEEDIQLWTETLFSGGAPEGMEMYLGPGFVPNMRKMHGDEDTYMFLRGISVRGDDDTLEYIERFMMEYELWSNPLKNMN